MSIEVIDNFLKEEDFVKIEESFLSSDIPWYHYDFKVSPDESEKNIFYESQMVHLIYNEMTPSHMYPLIIPAVRKLKVASLIKAKANLTSAWHKVEKFSVHTDNPYNNCKTSILYVNSNNGKTEFPETNESIESVRNRMVIFPSGTPHLGTTHTDSKIRVVINFNFFDGM